MKDNKSQDPLNIAFSDDNHIARVSLVRKSKGDKVANVEIIVAELEKRKFSAQLSAKIIDETYWNFLRSKELEKKITILSDQYIQLSQHILVLMSRDEMKASLTANIPDDKLEMLTESLILRLLKNKKIQYGVDHKKIVDFIKEINEKKGQLSGYPVAVGVPEIFGEDGSIGLSDKFKFEIQIEQKSKGGIKRHLPAQATAYNVRINDILATVYPAQKGKEGKTVTGQTLWSEGNTKSVRTPSLTISRNAEEKVHTTRIEYISSVEGRALLINKNILDVEMAVDGSFSLEISKNKLNCQLYMRSPQGGKKIYFSEVMEDITKAGISPSLSTEEFKAIVEEMNSHNDASVKKIPISEGTPPVNGLDQKITWNVNIDQAFIPALTDNGSIDFKQSNKLPIIHKDENVGTLYPATKGVTPGLDVYGKEIPPIDGLDFNMEISDIFDFVDGVQEERECKYLKARTSGLVILKGNNIKVLPVFEAKNVDYSTGNIDFDGNVIIKDSIADGFSVKATKDIIINGTIGACTIESKENIIVKGGINGRNKGLIKSNKNVIIKFAENCTIYAREKILVEKHCLLSRLISNGNIFVGKGNKGGKVVGSYLYSENTISTNYVGAETSTDSVLWSGVNKIVFDKLEKANGELALVANKLSELHMVKIETLSETALQEHYGTVRAYEKEKDKFQSLIENFQEHVYPTEDAKVQILNDVQEGTLVKVGEYEYGLSTTKSKVKFEAVNRMIKVVDLKNIKK